jgi:assimilatory nitrate reductase electron transfer subunit
MRAGRSRGWGSSVRVVVVGYGMAGARLVSEVQARRPALEVTVLGAEPYRAYNRILLSNLVAGRSTEDGVYLAEQAGPLAPRLGVTAKAIDRDNREVVTDDGERVPYDRLVLATGGRAAVPPVPGLAGDDGSLPPRVVAFRTLDDCRRIVALAGAAAAGGAGSALVLGGGLLGLEAARGLATRGLQVTVLHAVGHLMERQLDPAAGALLAATLAVLGIEVELDALTRAVQSTKDGVTAVLADGRRLAADLLVVACGIRPETGLATDAGLAVDRGIVVDDQLRTSDRRIHAIGDCAQHGGELGGLVAPAWEQARVVADLVTGADPDSRYAPRPVVTRLKAAGIDLAAMGDSTGDSGLDTVTFSDPRRGTYAKLVVREDRLAGAILLGDNPAVGRVIQLFDRAAPVADPRALLVGRPGPAGDASTETSPALIPDGAVICQCNTVTKGTLVGCWRSGARSTAELMATTRAGSGCGTCRDAVDGIATWLRRGEGDT